MIPFVSVRLVVLGTILKKKYLLILFKRVLLKFGIVSCWSSMEYFFMICKLNLFATGILFVCTWLHGWICWIQGNDQTGNNQFGLNFPKLMVGYGVGGKQYMRWCTINRKGTSVVLVFIWRRAIFIAWFLRLICIVELNCNWYWVFDFENCLFALLKVMTLLRQMSDCSGFRLLEEL